MVLARSIEDRVLATKYAKRNGHRAVAGQWPAERLPQ